MFVVVTRSLGDGGVTEWAEEMVTECRLSADMVAESYRDIGQGGGVIEVADEKEIVQHLRKMNRIP